MKKLNLFILLAVLTVSFGCSKDKSGDNDSKDNTFNFSGNACAGMLSEATLRSILKVPAGTEFVAVGNTGASWVCIRGFKDESASKEYALTVTVYPEAMSGSAAFRNEIKTGEAVNGVSHEAYWKSRQRTNSVTESGLYILMDKNVISVVYDYPNGPTKAEVQANLKTIFQQWLSAYK